ncbi:MAG: phosphoglucomutase/phosphomannomutase family protein [Dehalococcoidia bacterium]|nr:phosphoglucomutase/phosphomannomutase family protein [Dehalococcoidia bacterium]
MSHHIHFGTDGWRGVVAEDFTFANVRACAEGVARHYADRDITLGPVVVGYDTRYQSDAFARAVAEVLVAHGLHVVLADAPVPTPVICFNIPHQGAAGGIAITASHNPPEWNGFKCRSAQGSSESDETLAAIERHINAVADPAGVPRLDLDRAKAQGLVRSARLAEPYLEHTRRFVDLSLVQDAGLRIVADAMHGAGAGYLSALLQGGKTTLTEIRGDRNPAFPSMHNPEPIAHNLAPLSNAVRESHADVGVAFDGDADRLGVVDERGEYVSAIQVAPLLAYLLLEHRRKRGLLVKSLTASSIFWRLAERYSVSVSETKVGFKYIAPVLLANPDWLMGAEESGGYAFQGHVPERDGIVSALLFLELMARTGKRPSELVQHLFSLVGPHHYDRLDLAFAASDRAAIQQRVASAQPSRLADLSVERKDAPDGVRFTLRGGAWLVIRFSGTEPLVRIYAEAESLERVKALLAAGKALAGL